MRVPGSRVHAYRRIRDEIRARIDRGELRAGDPVGSERDLARRHGVSLMTARHALDELQREGRVMRRARVGTFVAPPLIQFNKLLGFSEQMASRGFAPHSRILQAGVVIDDPYATARLVLPPGSRLFRVERLRLGNDQPFAVETCYVSAKRFPDLPRVPLERRSLFAWLEQDQGVSLAYADEEVDATAADPRTADLLHIDRGAAVLRIRQVLCGATGEPVCCSLSYYRSECHSLLIRRFR